MLVTDQFQPLFNGILIQMGIGVLCLFLIAKAAYKSANPVKREPIKDPNPIWGFVIAAFTIFYVIQMTLYIFIEYNNILNR